MRVDLVTPFTEKDAAKALGARWDANKRTWYVQNVADLTPFARWIPERSAASAARAASAANVVSKPWPAGAARVAAVAAARGTVTQSVALRAHCGCDVLPWEPCTHHS